MDKNAWKFMDKGFLVNYAILSRAARVPASCHSVALVMCWLHVVALLWCVHADYEARAFERLYRTGNDLQRVKCQSIPAF